MCGQCFRWVQGEDGSFSGVAYGRFLRVAQMDNTLVFYNTPINDFNEIWVEYFDLNGDYDSMKAQFCSDETLNMATKQVGGIRILKQEPWEAICSFIISQNNNIPRIKGIIDRLCKEFGQPLENEEYTFPTADRIAQCSLEDLAPLRAGFRAKYILDAAQKISSKEVSIDTLWQEDTAVAQKELMKIKGIGPKVADCALLFGFYKLDAFPIDVWIKKVLKTYYPDGFPNDYKQYAGVAQQYLFHYIRTQQLSY